MDDDGKSQLNSCIVSIINEITKKVMRMCYRTASRDWKIHDGWELDVQPLFSPLTPAPPIPFPTSNFMNKQLLTSSHRFTAYTFKLPYIFH